MPHTAVVRSVSTGAAHHNEEPTPEERWAAALLAERAGYEAQNLRDRVAEVDAELSRVGVKPPAPETPKEAPNGRQGRAGRSRQ